MVSFLWLIFGYENKEMLVEVYICVEVLKILYVFRYVIIKKKINNFGVIY